MNLEDKVFDSFKHTFDLDGSFDRALLIYREYREWDSIGHMTLIAALETHFDVMLEANDILAMSSFAKAVEIMSRYEGD